MFIIVSSLQPQYYHFGLRQVIIENQTERDMMFLANYEVDQKCRSRDIHTYEKKPDTVRQVN